MVRLAFQGWTTVRIAARVGRARETVSRVLNSPLAQAELAHMTAGARALTVDTPEQVRRDRELDRLFREAQRFPRLWARE